MSRLIHRRLIVVLVLAMASFSIPWLTQAQSPEPPSSELNNVASRELEGSNPPPAEDPTLDGELSDSSSSPSSDQTDGPPAFYISKTELTLGLSAFLVALTTFIFGVAMTIVGYLSFAKYREAEKRLDKKFAELEEARTRIASLDTELDMKINRVREELRSQEKIAIENRRYFEAVRCEFFDLIVGIVEEVRHALGSGHELTLKALIGEAEACLSLFSPDEDEVTRSLWRLEQVGSWKSISPLKTLMDDSNADPHIRLQAQHALHIVTERLDDRHGSDSEPSNGRESEGCAEAEENRDEPP